MTKPVSDKPDHETAREYAEGLLHLGGTNSDPLSNLARCYLTLARPLPQEGDEEAARRIVWTDIQKFLAFVPNDDLEKRLAEFVEQNNNFNGDDVRAILLRVGRLRIAFALAEAELEAAEAVHDDNEAATVEEHAQYDRLADEVRTLRKTLEAEVDDAIDAEVQKLRKVLAEAIRVIGPDGGDTTRFYQLLEEVMPPDASKTIDELIEDSSFGTPGAKAIRDRTPKGVVDEVISKIKKGQGEE